MIFTLAFLHSFLNSIVKQSLYWLSRSCRKSPRAPGETRLGIRLANSAPTNKKLFMRTAGVMYAGSSMNDPQFFARRRLSSVVLRLSCLTMERQGAGSNPTADVLFLQCLLRSIVFTIDLSAFALPKSGGQRPPFKKGGGSLPSGTDLINHISDLLIHQPCRFNGSTGDLEKCEILRS